MPRKSRKQKIMTQQRIQTKITQKIEPEKPIKEEIRTSPATPSKKELVFMEYFSRDFRKSLILVSCVIALEIIFYFASMSTVWGKLFKF